ncbi:hypothetical protein JHK87_001374 [Glycine soja]|nr:hypothetical protein JHK87_001374 [Glycine soja]
MEKEVCGLLGSFVGEGVEERGDDWLDLVVRCATEGTCSTVVAMFVRDSTPQTRSLLCTTTCSRLRLHQNGGLGGWWRGGGGCHQRGNRKEVAAGEEVIVVVIDEEVAECVDPAKKKELDGLRAEMLVALVECVDPAKFMLEAISEVFPVDKRGEKAGQDMGWAYVLVLESLK